MSLIDDIIKLFYSNLKEKLELPVINRLLITNFTNLTVSFILLYSGIAFFLNNSEGSGQIMSFISAAIAIIILINYFINRNNANFSSYITISSVFISIGLIYLFFTQGPFTASVIWVLLLPIFYYIIYGRTVGTKLVFILLGLEAVILFIVNPFIASRSWHLFYNLEFIFATLAVSGLGYVIVFVQRNEMQDQEKIMLRSINENRSQDEFISQLSHQIRTPLSNILGVVSNFDDENLSENQKDHLETLVDSSNNLLSVVNDIVNKTQLKTQIEMDTIQDIHFNISKTLNNTARLYKSEDENVSIQMQMDESLPSRVSGNQMKFKQILSNILSKIIKHNANPYSNIKIKTRTHIFDEFAKVFFTIESNLAIKPADNSEDFSDGNTIHLNKSVYITKLELNLAQRLLQSEGSDLELVSTSLATSFSFDLSFRVSQTETVTKKADKPELAEVRIPRNKNVNINIKDANVLIVEDNPSNQQILELYIKNSVGAIEIAKNGKEALNKFGQTKYDIILMDVQMPIMDGYIATQKIRELEKSANTHTPIIAVTANAFPEDEEKCYAAGMDDYISKPFQPSDLLIKIKNNL